MKELERYHRYWNRKRFVTRALLIILTILICLLAITYYGINVGTFVIQVEDTKYQSLGLSIDENVEKITNRLNCNNLERCRDADFSFIPENIQEGLGSKNSDKGYYFAYSFYLVNTGEGAVSYELDYRITGVSKDIHKILRVLLYTDNEYNIYALSNSGEPEPIIVEDEDNIIGYTKPFNNDSKYGNIITQTYYDLRPQYYVKYTFVMWLDGWDKDQTSNMFGGALRTEAHFSIIR